MKSARLVLSAAALLAFAGCGDPVSADGLIDDSAVTLDVAASAGDAVATMLETMAGNEAYAGGSPDLALADGAPSTNVQITRSRNCFDAAGAAVANCLPFSSVRMIVVGAEVNGSRSSTRVKEGGATVTWTGTVYRVMTDTVRRVFTNANETSRVHDGNGVGIDSTSFTDGTLTRHVREVVTDSAKALTFNLPRSSNPYPVSGSVVRRASVRINVTSGDLSATRVRAVRAEVIFPADAQGNVTLKLDAKTCQLNLVTRAVTNCQ